MCGLTGIYHINGQPVHSSTLKMMTNALSHRGPDGDGHYIKGAIGLGHRRLAILDLSSAGAQPMSSQDKKWIIVFNGCIYNFRELKAALKRKGHTFRSTTDTEVISEGLAEYGVDFFKKLNGMFAVGAWHVPKNELYLARDRYGIKPIYYYFDGKTFVFASEVKALLKHPHIKVELHMPALNEYFTFQNLFRYHTLFKGIYLLPPANILKIDSSTLEIKHTSWWDFDFTNPDESMSLKEAQKETKRLLIQSVKKQLVADVPLGTYLSGGMDSSSITAIAAKNIKRLATFTAGFELSEVDGVESTFDERAPAELVAHHFQTEHYEQIIHAGDLAWSLPRVIWHMEDLRLGMSYPNYYISRLASRFVKVCLQGTGGDELFGGYPWRYYRVFRSLNKEKFFERYYHFWQRLVPDEQKKNLFLTKVYKTIQSDEPPEVFKKVFTFNDKLQYDSPEDHIQNSLYFEIKTFLHGLLVVGDKLSMAHGLEERYPFLDNDLVNFVQKIPVKFKLGNLEEMKRIDENELVLKKQYNSGKNILREAMAELLPAQIVARKKQGFSSPEESWYRGENAKYVKKLLLNKNTVSTEFISSDYIKEILNEHINKRVNHRLLIWSFISFEWWCRLFLNGDYQQLR